MWARPYHVEIAPDIGGHLDHMAVDDGLNLAIALGWDGGDIASLQIVQDRIGLVVPCQRAPPSDSGELSFPRVAKRRTSRYKPAMPNPEFTTMFAYAGYEIPVDLVNMTGGGPETFSAIADSHLKNLQHFIGLRSHHNILEVGCGIGRDAIPLTGVLDSTAQYIGVDIIGPSIEWCTANISARHPNFSFVHFDVKDQLHNPSGAISTAETSFPVEGNSIDCVILWSVFTHMFGRDIVHYLKEFRRVLKPGGAVWATCFLFDQEVLDSAQEHNLTPYNLRFEHEFEPGCRINDPLHPAGAVAYTPERIVEILNESGMKLESFVRGAWSGLPFEGGVGQDAMILTPLP